MNRGFTLIEVIVVIAIVSILAGIMIPFIYRIWESTDIETTKERMSDLKKAMVGDPRLIQNGMRIHYGYVGDCGTLPGKLENLIAADWNECPNWKGPYLPAGFNSEDYNKDAWGEEIIYDLSGKLISKGADRIQNTEDDISINIYDNEISEAKPVNIVIGNVNFSIYNSTSNPVTDLKYSLKVAELLYNQSSKCLPLDIGSINSKETKSVVDAFRIPPDKDKVLRNVIGKGQVITVRSDLFNDDSCNNNIHSTEMYIFVSSMSEELFINIPFSYTIK